MKKKRSQWDSNPRPLDPESNAISTPLCDRYRKVMKQKFEEQHSDEHRHADLRSESDGKILRITPLF